MKINDVYIQTKLIEGYSQFNYIGELFKISEINDKCVVLENIKHGVGCGISRENLEDYFELHISDEEKSAKEEGVKLIFSDRVIIAILEDGCKGISKCLENDIYNKDKGIEIAVTKAKIKSLKKKLRLLSK